MKRFLPVLLCACQGLTSSPEPSVSVLVRSKDACFALMNVDTPVSRDLGRADLCGYDAGYQMLAGIDQIMVVIDYGPDVEFSDTTAAPAPTLSVVIDGEPAALAVTMSDQQRVGTRAYFLATFGVPDTPSNDVRIGAGVNAGFDTELPDVFQIVPPTVSIALLDCAAGMPCELTGAVGSVHVSVSVFGDVPETIAIHSAIDGAPQPDTVPPLVTQPGMGNTTAIAAMPTPAAPDGATLAITAQLAGALPATASATVRAPAIASDLSCGTTCSLSAGDPVGLEVRAPAAIHPLQALVTTTLDGVPQLVAVPVTLVPMADGSAIAELALTAPSAGTWQIDSSVAGYPAPAIVTTVK